MRIGIYTGGLSRWGDNRYKMLSALGYSCVDFNMSNTDKLPYTLCDQDFAKYICKEKMLATDAGMEIFQVHGPWRWPPNDETVAQRAERMEKMRRSIYATADLGCKYWVVHPIMPFGIEDIGTGNEQATWDRNTEFMQELLITAKECDVTICLENMPMPKFSLGAPKDILRFVREINNSHFKICLDTGHVSVFPGMSPADVLRTMVAEVRVLHIHDSDGKFDRHWMPGAGVIDWADFGRALKETGFNGVFSLETAPDTSLSLSGAERKYAELFCISSKIIE